MIRKLLPKAWQTRKLPSISNLDELLFGKPTEEKKMSEVKYYVLNPTSYSLFNTLEEAQEDARADAFRYGKDQHILKTVAIARAPELIKNVTIDEVK